MADVTPDFNICLKEKGVQPILNKEYEVEAINSFLQEAYRINARLAELNHYLRRIRSSYLSATQPSRRRHIASDQARPLSDSDRDRIDAESKKLLRDLNAAIAGLKQAEDTRSQTEDAVALSKRAGGRLGSLGRWAAGGAVTAKSPEEELEDAAKKTVSAVRESIILFLQQKLEEAGRIQSEMMDVRLVREVEKSKSILAKSSINPALSQSLGSGVNQVAKGKQLPGSHDDQTEEMSGGPQLTQEQLQLFAQENHELVKHYEDQLDQVRTAERSILEISQLHTTLHANLQQQSEHIDQLVQDSFFTTENLGRGNKELKRASERRSTAQVVFYSTVAFCGFLVVWDLVF